MTRTRLGGESSRAATSAAILVKPGNDRFRAFVGVDAKVEIIYEARETASRLCGRAIVDPVYFAREGKREQLNLELLGDVDLENLLKFDLDGIDSIGPCVSLSICICKWFLTLLPT